MTLEDYREKENELVFENILKVKNLRLEYVNSIAEFKIGDYIYNITGIIKIERIGFTIIFGIPELIYFGYRYWKTKGILRRTKDKTISHLRSNVKLLQL